MDRPQPLMLDELEGQVRRVWTDAAGIGGRPARANRIADGFAQAGDRLLRSTDDPLEIAQAGLLRRFGHVDLPWLAAPDVTVLIQARTEVAVTMLVVRSLSRCPGCELVVLDDGGNPRTALLRAVVPNLVLARTQTPADAFRRGAEVARGRRIVLLDRTVPEPSAAALAALAEHTAPIVIGAAVMDRAMRTGVAGQLSAERARAAARLGLVVCVGAEFLPGPSSGDVDDVLAFSLRARDAGAAIGFLAEPSPGGHAWTH